jgi:predicted aconitase with swiveling domain
MVGDMMDVFARILAMKNKKGIQAASQQISQLTDNGSITAFVVLTQTEYDALTPDPTTVYIIQGV